MSKLSHSSDFMRQIEFKHRLENGDEYDERKEQRRKQQMISTSFSEKRILKERRLANIGA